MIEILVVLVVAGVLLWGVTQLPIDPVIVRIARVVVIVLLLLWLLKVMGLWSGRLP